MDFPLLTLLETAEDFRHLRGLRYPLWLLLLLLITGAMCGYWGARPMETFAQQYGGELCRQLNRPGRSATPSDSTFRRVLEQCDFIVLTRIFRQWAAASLPLSEAEWVAIDGKSIKGTMKDYASAQQNFVMMVSLFGHRRGFVYASEGMENQHQSEQQVVQQMLATLDLEGVVVTAEALHCQKKRSPAYTSKKLTTS